MDDDKIKNIVIQGYRDVLRREPDSGGLSHYFDSIKKGMTEERFYNILRTSEEYRKMSANNMLFNSQPQNVRSQNVRSQNTQSQNTQSQNTQSQNTQSQNSSDSITYCMMGTNRLHEIKPYIETALPYVDRLIFIDGESTDGTVEYLQSLNSKFPNKIDVHIHKWKDKFSGQRNNYLKHYGEKSHNGWILVSDTDEHFTQNTLSKLKELVVGAGEYSGISFQVEDIITDIDDNNKIVFQKVNPYWKNLLFKYHPKIRYDGEPHESLVGAPIRWKRTDLTYKHIRSQRKIYERAVENFFISNSNRYSPKWSEFRSMCTKYGISTFEQFFKLYKTGTLNVDIESWIYNHRNDSGNDGDSEVREMAKLYFGILHQNKRKL